MKSGLNGVGSNSNGLILWENDATGSRKVFKYLPDLREAMKNSKNYRKCLKYVFVNVPHVPHVPRVPHVPHAE